MARLPRFVLPGHPQHVIIRGNNRAAVFAADEDYRFFLDTLGHAALKHTCAIHAHVLMTNHVHLLVTPETESGIGKMIQAVGRYYVQYFNHCYQRTGTLWEGRYKACLIDSESYALTCYRYIELNPVRANMVSHPGEYPWSSYRTNAFGIADPLITPHPLYTALGPTAQQRQEVYRGLFAGHIDDQTLESVRTSINKAWVLGSPRFVEQVAQNLNRQAQPLGRGGDRRSEKFRVNLQRKS